ncbi:hypothetical protein DXG01_013258, partial [Tephrocybe rancida]
RSRRPRMSREHLGDATNERLLPPEDAERPSWNPVVSPAPRIKLAPPHKRRRAQKENQNPQAPPKAQATSKPRTSSSMTKPAPAPVRVLKIKSPLVVSRVQTLQKRSSRSPVSVPATNNPQVKPTFKVPAMIIRPASSTPPQVESKAPRATVPKSPVSRRPTSVVLRMSCVLLTEEGLSRPPPSSGTMSARRRFPPSPKTLTVPSPAVALDAKAGFTGSLAPP